MAYTTINFQTKKALRDAVASGTTVTVFQPNDMFGDGSVRDGTACIEGPHYPQPHRWYAQVVVEGGRIVKVK